VLHIPGKKKRDEKDKDEETCFERWMSIDVKPLIVERQMMQKSHVEG